MKRSEMIELLVSKYESLKGRRMDTDDFVYDISNIFLDTIEEAGMLPPAKDGLVKATVEFFKDNDNYIKCKLVKDENGKIIIINWEPEDETTQKD